MFRKTLIALAILSVGAPLFAQVATDAVIVGTVTDASQASIEGAIVTVTQNATGAVTKTVTNSRGQYRTPPLRIGEYTVAIGSKGFKQFRGTGVILDIGAISQLDVSLEPGEVSESVEVQSAPQELLQSSDSTVGTVITNQQIVDLPLNGRDYLQLATLSAGTTPALGTSGGIGIGGQAGSRVAFLLDGLDNNNQQISTGHSGQKEIIKPSVDAIQEFKVVTNGYSAEYGRSSSGVVSVQLKSGTNAIHGTAFEFLRNNAADARNYFAQQNLPFKQNQFGGTIGGPILKDRVFAFGDVEFLRLRQQTPSYSLVPTTAQRTGQFSSVIYDPSTYNAATKTRLAFTGNQIPQNQLDPVALKVLGFFPTANATPTANNPNNFLYNSPAPSNNYRWDVRFDQILSGSQTLYERYSSQHDDQGVISSLPPLNGQYYAGSGAQTTDSKSFIVGYNTSWSPTVLASLRAGWNFLYWHNFYPSQSLTSVGIPGVETVYPGFSQIAVSNYATLGVSNVPNIDASEDREVAGDLTWIRGSHTLKLGWQEYWLQTNFNSSQKSSGIFNFNGQYTSKSGSSGSSEQALADFLLGTASKEQLSSTAILNFRAPYTHFFVQDDWTVSRNLTLNLGLRYELSPPAVDKHNAIANFDLDTDPNTPRIVQAGSEGSGRSARALQDVSYTGVAPRMGFAYKVNDKTVLRGGYGIFYSNLITLGGMQSLEINPPNSLPRVTISPNATAPTNRLKNGFPDGTLSFTNGKNVQLASYDRHATVPTDQQWNLNIQRELPFGIVTEVGYYSNKFDHSWWQVDGNPAPPTPTSQLPAGGINANRRFTSTSIPVTGNPTITLADVIRIRKSGWSQYNALQVKVEKRYAKGLTFLGSYAYSKTLGIGDTAGIQDQFNVAAERSVSSTDMRHHFVGSMSYPLPFGRGRRFGNGWNRWTDVALGGWSFSPIVTLSSGTPLNLIVSSNPSNTGGAADRPNVVGDWHLSNRRLGQWFNTSAFVANASGVYGNAGRNLVISPGTFNLDAALRKDVPIKDRVSLQLRLESFNATNTPQFGSPGVDVNSTKSFGVISTAGAPRENQVALKLLF
jgi:hypothetical protein